MHGRGRELSWESSGSQSKNTEIKYQDQEEILSHTLEQGCKLSPKRNGWDELPLTKTWPVFQMRTPFSLIYNNHGCEINYGSILPN